MTERLFLGQAAEKDPYASLRSIDCASTYKSTPQLIDFRAPRLWAFLSSLRQPLISSVLKLADAVTLFRVRINPKRESRSNIGSEPKFLSDKLPGMCRIFP